MDVQFKKSEELRHAYRTFRRRGGRCSQNSGKSDGRSPRPPERAGETGGVINIRELYGNRKAPREKKNHETYQISRKKWGARENFNKKIRRSVKGGSDADCFQENERRRGPFSRHSEKSGAQKNLVLERGKKKVSIGGRNKKKRSHRPLNQISRIERGFLRKGRLKIGQKGGYRSAERTYEFSKVSCARLFHDPAKRERFGKTKTFVNV